jgi:hypothetical protein
VYEAPCLYISMSVPVFTMHSGLTAPSDCGRCRPQCTYLRTTIRDLQIRLDTSFALTANQKVSALFLSINVTFLSEEQANIRGIAQDTVHEATRTVFATMHVDFLVCVRLSRGRHLLIFSKCRKL